MISKINISTEYFSTRIINNVPVNDLISLGKLKYNSTIETLGKGQSSKFNLILCSELLSFLEYKELNYQKKIKDNMIIDGISFIKKDRDSFERLLDNFGIAPTVFTDLSEIEDFDILKDLGFTFWNWSGESSKSLLNESNFHNYFTPYNNSIRKYNSLIINEHHGNSILLTDIVNNLSFIDKTMGKNDYLIRSEFSKLFSMVLSFSRLIAVPDEEFLKNLSAKLNEIDSKIKKNQILYDKELIGLIKICIEYFQEIIQDVEKTISGKIDLTEKYLLNNKYDNIYLLVEKGEHISFTKLFWKKRLIQKHIKNYIF